MNGISDILADTNRTKPKLVNTEILQNNNTKDNTKSLQKFKPKSKQKSKAITFKITEQRLEKLIKTQAKFDSTKQAIFNEMIDNL